LKLCIREGLVLQMTGGGALENCQWHCQETHRESFTGTRRLLLLDLSFFFFF
jgi:hypothetical protein